MYRIIFDTAKKQNSWFRGYYPQLAILSMRTDDYLGRSFKNTLLSTQFVVYSDVSVVMTDVVIFYHKLRSQYTTN